MTKILQQADVRERFAAQHGEIVSSTPQAFGRFIAGEITQWKAVAKAGHIKAE